MYMCGLHIYMLYNMCVCVCVCVYKYMCVYTYICNLYLHFIYLVLFFIDFSYEKTTTCIP